MVKHTQRFVLVVLLLALTSLSAFAQETPTEEPTVPPAETEIPTEIPPVTVEPTGEVTMEPTGEVTVEPTSEPTGEVTSEPTDEVTSEPTGEVTSEPTGEVTSEPTGEVTSEPTGEVTAEPTSEATSEAPGGLTLTVLGTFLHGSFGEGAAEIVAHDPQSQTLFVVNGESHTVDMLDMSNPASLTLKGQIDITEYGDSLTSVAVHNGIVAVAITADPVQDPGTVGFFATDGSFINAVTVGALPDMVTFSPDGTKVVTADEGEPSSDYTVDPNGSVSIVDISSGAENATVTTVTFEGVELDPAVRIYGANAGPAQDIEPEYIAVSPDSTTAYVTLQENNALGVIDLTSGTVTAVYPLGFKDHSLPGNELDASGDDGEINIANWPIFGMYQPDGIDAYEANGQLYLVTANEGDVREYDGYSEAGELGETPVDEAFPNADTIITEAGILGLEVVTSLGDTDGDGDLDQLYLPGARSFSIWSTDGTLVYDSGAQIEQIVAEQYPDDFNSTNDENGDFDGRSDNKGPEPEGVTLGEIDGRTYAFVGLERMSGVMVFDITDPADVSFITYVNNRDFSGDAEAGTAGDLGPEGLIFIPASESPTGNNLLVIANEISGTTTVYEIQ
jgi:2',3'-cyclic-nucleotide 2'-phosphodiesterase/3'-nucleotidase/5'-nucleotidase